ncbi:unnamed protein product [Ilex paraguariensis]|uniref:E3 UFM1-protein ligase 1-like domain-containing protein n=1 Tax=Ilex paraguariensis TaxID=185542 RepID=A0ABC8RVZ2_9AQUA
MALVPDFEEQGIDDLKTILVPLAHHLRPMLLNSWKERSKVAFTENAERMKNLLDNLQQRLDEPLLNMQLYEKALDLFEDDQSTSVLLHRHLLRTTATSMVDTLLLNLVHGKALQAPGRAISVVVSQLKNPRLFHTIFPDVLKYSQRKHFSIFSCREVEFSVPKRCLNSLSLADNGFVDDERLRSSVVMTNLDVATLRNLCVDIVLNVPKLPPKLFQEWLAYMEELSKSLLDKDVATTVLGQCDGTPSVILFGRLWECLRFTTIKQYWETGGNCNMAIAAARLGLHCVAIGHVDVLHDEGIGTVGMSDLSDNVDSSSAAYETLLGWVLVDPFHRHGFCSQADFCKEPAFSWLSKLSIEVKMAIKQSKLLFCNGYGFDELSPCLIISALDYVVETLVIGTLEEQRALDKFLRMSDVLLLTSEDESLTGIGNPILAAQELLRKRVRTKWVIVKMGAKGSILITMSNISCAPAFKDPDKEYSGFILHKGTLLFPTSEEIGLCLQMIKLFKMSLVLA